MRKIKNSLAIVVLSLLIFIAGNASGQLRISSPYSRYGLGEIHTRSFPRSMAMGGIGYSLRDSLSLNIQNPASYTGFDSLSFLCEIGLNSNFTQLQTANITQDFLNNTTLGYLIFGFPVTRWCGISLGIVPYSRTGYKLVETDTVSGAGEVTGKYEGYGGMNRFYVGSGFLLHRDLSLGFNASFLFGTLTNKSAVYFNDLAYVFNTRVNHITVINDFNFELGLQYHHLNKNRSFINAGLVYQLPFNMNARKTYLVERFTISSTETEVTQDTIVNIESESGKVYLPGGLGGGVSVGKKDFWMLGLDVNWQNWNKFRNFGEEDSLKSSLYSGLGFCITPARNATSNYFKRMTYSAGIRYNSSYLELHDHPINEWAVSVGFDFPLRTRNFSYYSLRLAAEYGQRGTTKYNLIKESFVRFTLGFSIKETWFFRKKID